MEIISYGQGTDLHVIKKQKYVYKYGSIIYKVCRKKIMILV